jgi:hypothetical protein
MGGFLTTAGELLTSTSGGILSNVSSFTGMILTEPLLVLPFVIMVVGLAVGIIGRLLNLR